MTLPPAHLMLRVSRNDDPDVFTETGKRMAGTVIAAAFRRAKRPVRDVLDWGCGCGRVTRWLAEHEALSIYGCDIDAETVAWCQGNLPGQFAVSGLWPPLPYPDGSFDAVLACSVMTHLGRRAQRKWLPDLARVLRPGGVLIASVHGHAAASDFNVTDLADYGIRDHWLDTALNGVAPEGYYRTVLQDEQYTRVVWADWFEIVSYEECALERHDLVIGRPKDQLRLSRTQQPGPFGPYLTRRP